MSQEQKRVSALTPEGRFSYPSVFQAKYNKLNKKNEFGLDILLPLNAKLDILKMEMARALEKKFGKDQTKWPHKLPNFKSPFKKQDDLIAKAKLKGQPTAHLTPGAYYLTLRKDASKGPAPQVYNQNKQQATPAEIYGGCYGVASINAYAYDQGGNVGVSFSLVNVMKTREGEPFGTAPTVAEDDFASVDFAQSEIQASNSSLDDLL